MVILNARHKLGLIDATKLTEYDSVWRRRQPVDTFIANEYGNCHNTFSESSSEPTSIMGWY